MIVSFEAFILLVSTFAVMTGTLKKYRCALQPRVHVNAAFSRGQHVSMSFGELAHPPDCPRLLTCFYLHTGA